MKFAKRTSPLLFCVIAAIAFPAIAQQPPDVVNSDAYFNTATGTDALFSLTPGITGPTCPIPPPGGECKHFYHGSFNTAAGYEALYSGIL